MRIDLKAFFVLIFFISGASASAMTSSWLLPAAGVLISAAAFFFGRRFGLGRIFACSLFVCFISGSFYFHLRASLAGDAPAFYEKTRAVIVSFPERRLNDQRFEVELSDPPKSRAEVYTRLYPYFRYGDVLRISGRASVEGRIFFPEISKEASGGGNRLKALLFDLREKLVGRLKHALVPSSAALAAGILFGDQSGFTPEMWELFRMTGTTHLVALSGFNIAVVANCVLWLFCLVSRRVGLAASVIAVILFVVMAGGEASAVRAAIMGIILVFGRGVGRKAGMRNVITAAAFLMVVADPGVVVGNIGFELSFAAVIGMIYLPPLIRRSLKLEEKGGFRDMCIDTLSAEAAVLPIILLRFGGMSWYSFLVNIAVVFTVPLAMVLGFAVAVLGDGFGPISALAAVPADVILQYELKTIDIFSGIF